VASASEVRQPTRAILTTPLTVRAISPPSRSSAPGASWRATSKTNRRGY